MKNHVPAKRQARGLAFDERPDHSVATGSAGAAGAARASRR
jgi:hypothetical protein